MTTRLPRRREMWPIISKQRITQRHNCDIAIRRLRTRVGMQEWNTDNITGNITGNIGYGYWYCDEVWIVQLDSVG
jgi:hypothetical protein